MAVNLIDSNDIEVSQTGSDIQLNLTNPIESGSNANGSYIKYGDGTMICWNRESVSNIQVATQDGGIYKSADITLKNFPVEFNEIPVVQFCFSGNSWTILGLGRSASDTTTKTNPGKVFLFRGTSTTTGVVGLYIHTLAIGRWKA